MNSLRTLTSVLLGAVLSGLGYGQDLTPMPLYSFGVIADVQYADQPDRGARHYRTSLQRLAACVEDLNRSDLKFVVQLGDFIDTGKSSFDAVLPHWNRLRARRFHVIGNHDLPILRGEVMKKLGLTRSYYDFSIGERWRFVVVDGMDVSLHGYKRGHPKRREATAMLKVLKAQKAPNAVPWNGGLGKDQMAWLKSVLEDATKKRQRVCLFCHFPVQAGAGGKSLLLLNHQEVSELLAAYPCVAAWLNGHHHAGGYVHHGGVHYVTLVGMVEAPKRNAYAVVDVFESRLVLRGIGKQPGRVLPLR